MTFGSHNILAAILSELYGQTMAISNSDCPQLILHNSDAALPATDGDDGASVCFA